ncbi:MAG: hypothetical protein MSQ05_08520 [Akkermansia sp.]|nr:hypothetical protein [Akkermansia sp.]
MKRLTYIYGAVPLFALLSCAPTAAAAFGVTAMLCLGSLILIAAWGLVWLRMFGMPGKRPEFSILAVLPHGVYLALKTIGAENPAALEPFTANIYQGLYLLIWIASACLLIGTLRPGPEDPAKPASKDPVFIVMCVLIAAYTASGWSGCTVNLFPSLLHS